MTTNAVDLAAAGLDLSIEGAVATVTLNRPARRNAMTPSMWHGLASVGMTIPDDVRVVLVRGAGPSFCAGIDLRVFSPDGVPGEQRGLDPNDPGFMDEVAGYQAGFTWLRNPSFVSVAVVQGHAIGAGFQLALSCDLRVLSTDAKLCMREPELGLVPDLTGTKPLVDLVGLPRALEICVSARTIDAAEARELRLAEWVVSGDDLDARGQRAGQAPAKERPGGGTGDEGPARPGRRQYAGAAGRRGARGAGAAAAGQGLGRVAG